MNDHHCIEDGIKTESGVVKKSGTKQQTDSKQFSKFLKGWPAIRTYFTN